MTAASVIVDSATLWRRRHLFKGHLQDEVAGLLEYVSQVDDNELYETLGHNLAKCLLLQTRWEEQGWAAPLSGSVRAADDAALNPYQLSHAVRTATGSSLDHFLALQALVAAGQIHMAAPFTLVRAALENASLALWLVAPNEQADRFRRRLLLELDDATDSNTAVSLTSVVPPATLEQRRSGVMDIASTLNIDQESIAAAGRAGLGKSAWPGRPRGWAPTSSSSPGAG